METIIAGILTGTVGIVTCLINNHFQNRKTVALVEYRLLQLEKKQDKYNNLIKRTFELEKAEKVLEEKILVANHRISDLEK